MTIYYFGDFDPAYARNRVLIHGLEENGVDVVICNDRAKSWRSRFRLIQKVRHSRRPQDRIIVGYSDSRWAVPLLRLFGCGPVIWDAFYSMYDTYVFDRKIVQPNSPKAMLYWFLDWMSCQLSNKILLDTQEHIRYFARVFHVSAHKCIRVFVGTDDVRFKPEIKPRNVDPHTFVVGFHGKFIPVQGVQYIVQAAKLLESDKRIKFKLVGTGQTHDEAVRLAKELHITNIEFVDHIPFMQMLKDISSYINTFDIGLGLFGDTQKTQRAIPNKVYEYMAMKKAVITGDTPAARELLINRKHALLVKVANAADLAQKINILANDETLRNALADAAYTLFKERLTPKSVAADLLSQINSHHD